MGSPVKTSELPFPVARNHSQDGPPLTAALIGHLWEPYAHLLVFIPMAAIFVIVLGIFLRSLGRIPLLTDGPKVGIALCATIPAICRMNRTLVRALLPPYTVTGVAALFSLPGLLLTPWIGLTVETPKPIRRSRQDDQERA